MLYRIGLVVLYLFAALCSFRGVAAAQTDTLKAGPALWAPSSWSAGVGGAYEARVQEGGPTSSGPAIIAYVARPLTQFAITGRGSWRADTKNLQLSPALHYRFPVVGEHFAASLAYDFFSGGELPLPANEWSVGLVWAKRVVGNLDVAVSASYGLDSHDLRPAAQLTIPLHTARN